MVSVGDFDAMYSTAGCLRRLLTLRLQEIGARRHGCHTSHAHIKVRFNAGGLEQAEQV
jgi:hypothetical protein